MKIERDAPLTGHKETVINAPVETVWAVQTDIERWPEWNPDVSIVALEGGLAAGSTFRWKASGLNIVSTIQELEPQRRIGWTGVSLGMRAIHIWTFEPQGGGTRVTTEESLSGWMPRLIKLISPRFLEQSLEKSLQILKVRAERA